MNQFLLVIRGIHHIRKEIFRYLKPSEISNTCIACETVLSNYEKSKYMNPINELFWSTELLIGDTHKYNSSIVLLGGDIDNITNDNHRYLHFHIYINKPHGENKEIGVANFYDRLMLSVYSDISVSRTTDLVYVCKDKRIKCTIFVNPTFYVSNIAAYTLITAYESVLEFIAEWKANDYILHSNRCEINYLILDAQGWRYEQGTLTLSVNNMVFSDCEYKTLTVVGASPSTSAFEMLIGSDL